MASFFPFRMGHTSVALIETSKGFILVDAGVPGTLRVLTRQMKRLGLAPKELLLVVVTHVHYDHVGSLAAVRRMTGAEVLVQAAEKTSLETAETLVPKGTTRFSKAIAALVGSRAAGKSMFEAVVPDIVIDSEFDLSPFGIRGRAVHTPGHTAGSLSVILDSGEAFVGDACWNVGPFSRGTVFPPFVSDVTALGRSWKRLLDSGAGTFYPGHGRPFGRAKLMESYTRKFDRPAPSEG